MNMRNTFEILAGFLDRLGDEVEGRELQAPSPELQSKLRSFARGALPASEQPEVLGLLSRNPQWIALLADEVKTLRGN